MNDATISGPVLVTGATGRIGRVIVAGLVQAGVEVVGLTRSRPAHDATSAQTTIRWVQADLLSPGAIAELCALLDDAQVEPTAIVHAARRVEDVALEGAWPSTANWQSEMALALAAPADLVLRLAHRPRSALRHVVLLSSMYGVVAVNPNLYANPEHRIPIHYGVIRAGVIQLAKELAVRLAPAVQVNAVSFGGVRGRVGPEFERRYANLCPAARMLDDTDLFGPIEFLLSSAASGMTGQNVIVDGGWTIW